MKHGINGRTESEKMSIEKVIKDMESSAKAENGDYIGDDGLLYCGKCHTRKQVQVTLPNGNVFKPMCLCKCERERVEREEKEIKARERLLQVERYRDAGFSDRDLKRCKFSADDGKSPDAIKMAKNYVKHFADMKRTGQGLLLYGGVGTGKTFIASCIANALIDECVPCMVTNISRVVNQLSGMFEGKQNYIDSLSKYSLLIIDDFGMERATDYVNEIVYNIIDTRYRSGLPLIVTTNLDLATLKNPPDIEKSRIYSRIMQMCYPLKVEGRDRRQNNVNGDVIRKLYE